MVVVDGDGDSGAVHRLVVCVVELRHVRVLQRLRRRDALVRVELQQLGHLRRACWVLVNVDAFKV